MSANEGGAIPPPSLMLVAVTCTGSALMIPMVHVVVAVDAHPDCRPDGPDHEHTVCGVGFHCPVCGQSHVIKGEVAAAIGTALASLGIQEAVFESTEAPVPADPADALAQELSEASTEDIWKALGQ